MSGRAYFNDGDVIGGTLILGRVSDGRMLEQATYAVRMNCCGRERTLQHKALLHRAQRDARQCSICRKERDKDDPGLRVPPMPYGVVLPAWVPTEAGRVAPRWR